VSGVIARTVITVSGGRSRAHPLNESEFPAGTLGIRRASMI
jgi:hypothetical protein